ncbi:MAG: hypothetical protein FH748_03755 [Balneolaceae bacterium]|nr:hypothetical protein [Balneolaceae bacterium]
MDNQRAEITVAQVTAKLKQAYRDTNQKEKGAIFFRAFLILLAGFSAFVVAEQLLYFSGTTKSVSLFLLVAIAAYKLWRGYSSVQKISFEDYYRDFSRKSKLTELKDSLDLGKDTIGNPALVNAAILQNMTRIKPGKLDQALQSYSRQTSAYSQFRTLGALTGMFVIVASVTAFNFTSAASRTITFWESFEKPNPYLFTISPGDITVEQGQPFSVSVQFKGAQQPEKVVLHVKTTVEEEYRSRVMAGGQNTYTSIPFDLNNDLLYYVQMDEYRSPVYEANVQLPPRFTELKAAIQPPAYTGLDRTQLSYPFSQIRAYQGSQIEFSGIINKEVIKLFLLSTSDTLSLQTDSTFSFSHRVPIAHNDTLTFVMEDGDGLTNKNPFQVIITPRTDEYPVVEVIEPEASFEKVNPKQIELLYRATDDFGLTRARLKYELSRAYVENPLTGTLSLENPENGVLQPFNWDLEELRLKPQDVLSFWVEVADNDGYNGRKTTRSQVLTLSVPSMVDYFESLDEKEENVDTELDDISESFKQMQDSYKQFKEKMKEQPEQAGYEQKKELEQTKKLQEDVQKKVDDLNKQFEEIKKELSENSMLSEETQRAYEELQKLMEEVDDPEFLKLMEEMRKKLVELSPEQLRNMMEQTEFKEEEYRQRLERTIELFKQLKLSSDLDKITQSFKDLARKEGEMEQNKPPKKEQDQQREKTIEDTKKIQEQIEELSENTTSGNRKDVEEYQKNTKREIEKLLEKLKKQLEDIQKKNNEQNGQQNQNSNTNFQQQYQQLAQKTEELKNALSSKQMQINISGLQYALYSLLNLSVEQEDLVTLASATENRSQAYVGYARDQKNIESIFSSISDSLFQLSSQIPQFSNQINTKKLEVEKRLSRSLKQMAERDQSQSSVASRQAMGGINEIAFMVANLLEQLQNSNSGSGSGQGMSMQQMMEQMQKSGKNQQQLNQQMQDLINDIQGERLTKDQMERLNQLAKQQNQIRKQLEELQRSGALKGGDKLGSELQRAIEEMENTINDLRGGVTDPTLINRQQNILSRMLEAEKAMQERDQQEKREGSTADQILRQTSPELTLEELEKQIRNRLNDPNFTKYSADYQRLIEKYFELLKKLQERELQ